MVHPHIVAFREVFLTEEHLGVVMEFVDGGNMFQYVKQRGSLHEDEGASFSTLTSLSSSDVVMNHPHIVALQEVFPPH